MNGRSARPRSGSPPTTSGTRKVASGGTIPSGSAKRMPGASGGSSISCTAAASSRTTGPTSSSWTTRRKGFFMCIVTRDYLLSEYVDKRRSTTAIGKELGVSTNTVNRYLRREGIPIRPRHVYNNNHDLSDRRFGSWLVLGRIKNDVRQRTRWRCRCRCGAEAIIERNGLVSGRRKICKNCNGKLQRDPSDVRQAYWSQVKRGAKKRGIPFIITREQARILLVQQKHECALSGLSIGFADTVHDYWHGGSTASLDRIDHEGAYTISNVQWVHKKINKMKGVFSQEEFIKLCQLVTKHTTI